ncbi:MAG: hypothetical protein ABEJ42_03780 [Halobacteriaceae archaeon]
MERNVVDDGHGGLPWYVKVALLVIVAIMVFVIGIDLLELAANAVGG